MLDEASRLIPVRDGNRTVTLSMKQAIIRRLAVDAVKGDPRAQRLFTEMLTLSEDEAQRAAEQAGHSDGPRIVQVVFGDDKEEDP